MHKARLGPLVGGLLTVAAVWAGAAAAAETPVVVPPAWQWQAAERVAERPDPAAWRPNREAALKASGRENKELHNYWLRQPFVLPEAPRPGRYWLDFELINGHAVVFVNGKRAGERLGPFGKVEATGLLREGENELLVFCTRNYTDVPLRPEEDFLCAASRGPDSGSPMPYEQWQIGVPRPVALVFWPSPAAIVDAWAETSWRRKELALKLELHADRRFEGRIRCRVLDAENREALAFERPVTLEKGDGERTVVQSWADPIPWELEAGYLYTAEVELLDGDGTARDRTAFPFGFREVWTEGRTLVMNGHPSRWRVDWNYFGLNEASLSFLKLYGRNVVYYQNNPTNWWRNWPNVVFHVDGGELDLLDRAGVASLLPTPPGFRLGDALLADTPAARQYRALTEELIRRYRRHPSVLGWCVSMNAFNPRDSIVPETMGRRTAYPMARARHLEKSMEIVKAIDPTRLVYGHADGNNGDLASGNVYPNFAPPQEVADWPEPWSRKGDMPWWAAEYAAVYNGSYFKGGQFLMTEYGAIFFGEDAYAMESDAMLAAVVDINKAQRTLHGHLGGFPQVLDMKHAIEERYIDATDRAWRTWGELGWHYFNFHEGFGEPPEAQGRPLPWQNRYAAMRQPVAARPPWANRAFDLYRRHMQPLLVYLAGSPAHTDRTHAYFSGETVEKNLAAVWDGPGRKRLDLAWRLVLPNGDHAREGRVEREMRAGDIALMPVTFDAPTVERKTAATIEVLEGGAVVDRFPLEIFPPAAAVAVDRPVRVFDPSGRSLPWIRRLCPEAAEYRPGEALADGDLLVLGREALKPGAALPVTAAAVASGVRVLVLEQTPDAWTKMGFNTLDAVSRQVFPGTVAGGWLDGLAKEDLAYWRGTPDLLPEYRRAYSTDAPMAPKGSNRHGVASTVLEIPSAAGFLPLLQAEFDMAYTPLLAMPHGRGAILFSTLDFTGRVGVDPAATRLAGNLLRTLATAEFPSATVLTVGDSDAAAPTPETLERHLADGGKVLYAGLSADALRRKGLVTRKTDLRRVRRPAEGFASRIPQSLMRWRDRIAVDAVVADEHGGVVDGDGLFCLRPRGAGAELFLQASPASFADADADPARRAAAELSVLRVKQLTARAETELGRHVDAATVTSIVRASNSASFRNINTWFTFGPFRTDPKVPAEKRLEAAYPGEKEALAGDMNPNHVFRVPDGRDLDFRNTVTMDATGFVDLSAIGRDADGLVYAISHIQSDTRRKAVFRFGFDYYGMVYLNGKPILQVAAAHSAPMENRFTARATLKPGENTLVVKVLPGSKGFGFWGNMSDAETAAAPESAKPAALYDKAIKIRNPYEYVYW